MVSTDHVAAEVYQQIADLSWPEWPGYAITQIDDLIYHPMSDVIQHRFQCRKVAMDVCNDCEAHPNALSRFALSAHHIDWVRSANL